MWRDDAPVQNSRSALISVVAQYVERGARPNTTLPLAVETILAVMHLRLIA